MFLSITVLRWQEIAADLDAFGRFTVAVVLLGHGPPYFFEPQQAFPDLVPMDIAVAQLTPDLDAVLLISEDDRIAQVTAD